jgi:hypothetical protein
LRGVVRYIADHALASLFLIDDIVEVLLAETDEVEEHEVPAWMQVGHLAIEHILLVDLGDQLRKFVDVEGLILRDG